MGAEGCTFLIAWKPEPAQRSFRGPTLLDRAA
jgi:hypothetical protein